MGYELIKSQIETNVECNDNYQVIDNFEERESEYFNIKVRNRKYPSCYQYNILIMLAKRLIKEEEERQEKINACDKRTSLYKKLAFRIIDD